MAQPQQQQKQMPIRHLSTKWPEVDVVVVGGAYVATDDKGREIELWPPHQDESLGEWIEGLSNRQIEAFRIIHYEKWCLDTGNHFDKQIWQNCEAEKEFRMSFVVGAPAPTDPRDAVTKAYVEQQMKGGG